MGELKSFITGHEELIHDVSYDFYGKHLATCSSDQHIKVFDLDQSQQSWVLNDSWKAHESSIVKVAWAAPQFGHLLVSVSYDTTVRIWEEDIDEPPGSGRRWKRVCDIPESSGPLYDVAFAPAHLGLKFGTIGSDGKLRVYESADPSDLSKWTTVSEISVLSIPPAKHLQSAFSLTWCPSRFSTEKVIVCALDQGFIYQINSSNGKYNLVANLPDHNGLIRSVSWAPSMGRFYQLLATGCKDGYVRIFKLTEKTKPNLNNLSHLLKASEDDMQSESPSRNNIEIELLSEHNDHKGEVWEVSWNSTGTILSSCGDDGKVRLWKANYSNEFKCMSVISAKRD